MKRISAIILTVAIFLSLCGCEINIDEEEMKDHIEDQFSQAADHVKDEASNKADELMEDAIDQADKILDSIKELPMTILNGLFSGGSSSNEDDSDQGCACDSFDYKKVASTHWWPFNWTDDTYVLKCKKCGSPCPVDKLTFSVFLKWIYNGKDPESLSQKKKDKALEPYIRSKVWMLSDELSDYETEKNIFTDVDSLGAFEFYAILAGTPGDIKEKIPVLNCQAFFLFQNYLPTAFSDAGVESSFLDIVGDVGSVCDFVQLCGAAETSTKAWENYNNIVDSRPGDTYGVRQAYIEAAVSNANLMAAFTDFLGIFDISVGAPTPKVEYVLEDVKELAKHNDLETYYRYLSAEESLINKDITVNYVLHDNGFTEFPEIKTYTDEMIEAAMKQGPTSSEIAEAIPYIIAATNRSEKNLSKTISSALWYYYGWRQEYEYAKFIEWIYADEPGTFQSYLKGE